MNKTPILFLLLLVLVASVLFAYRCTKPATPQPVPPPSVKEEIVKNDSVLKMIDFIKREENSSKFLLYKVRDTSIEVVFVYNKRRYTIFLPDNSDFISYAVRPDGTTAKELLVAWLDNDFDGKAVGREETLKIPDTAQEKYTQLLKDFFSKFKLE